MNNQSPAEGLRQQILKDGTVHYMTGAFSQKHYSNGTVSPIEHKAQEVVEIGIDDLMELVTAYAATVEREAAIRELEALVDDNDAEEAPICHFGQGMHSEDEECFREYGRAAGVTQILDVARSRLAALQGPQDGDAE
jgi:hypothetical protein